ncbi:MAG: hypothetical protein HZA68_12970 [Rhodovulum sp.]|nr:hypothetical protein [Rhodovulum sp.]
MGPITDTHKLTYKMNVELALQQTRSKLDPAFTYQPSLKGRLAQFLELMGATTAVRNLGKAADTPNIDAAVEPIWISPQQLAWGRIMEVEDAIKAVMDHQSDFIRGGAAAMIREKDAMLRDAIFGSRRIGQDGGTTSTWSGETVGVGVGYSSTDDTTATGMNVKKLIRARRYLQYRNVDVGMEQIFFVGNAQQIEELFRDTTFINGDYRTKKVLDQPENLPILGMTILPPIDGSLAFADYDASTYTAAVVCRSGLHWGDFDPLRTDIPLRPDKMNRPHPHMEHWLGASRSEDYKVVKILTKK